MITHLHPIKLRPVCIVGHNSAEAAPRLTILQLKNLSLTITTSNKMGLVSSRVVVFLGHSIVVEDHQQAVTITIPP